MIVTFEIESHELNDFVATLKTLLKRKNKLRVSVDDGEVNYNPEFVKKIKESLSSNEGYIFSDEQFSTLADKILNDEHVDFKTAFESKKVTLN